MASKTGNVARRIRNWSGVALGLRRNYVYVQPTQFIVHGLLVEPQPYKDSFYVWHLYYPLFVERTIPHLSYSERIDGGRRFEGSAEEVANQIIEQLNATVLGRSIAEPLTIQGFFEACNQVRQGVPTWFKYRDFACCHILENDLPRAESAVTIATAEFAKMVAVWGLAKMGENEAASLQELSTAIASGPNTARALVLSLVDRSAAALGIERGR